MAGIYHPSRGGVRGGKDQFNWDDVKTDKDRENYLGHSVMVPVGKWQEGKDLIWYTRDKKGQDEKEMMRRKELQAVKDLEKRAMAAALGKKSFSVGSTTSLTAKELQEVLSRGHTEHNPDERIHGVGHKKSSKGSKADKYGTSFEGFDATAVTEDNEEPKKKSKKKKKEKKKKKKYESDSNDNHDDVAPPKKRREYFDKEEDERLRLSANSHKRDDKNKKYERRTVGSNRETERYEYADDDRNPKDRHRRNGHSDKHRDDRRKEETSRRRIYSSERDEKNSKKRKYVDDEHKESDKYSKSSTRHRRHRDDGY